MKTDRNIKSLLIWVSFALASQSIWAYKFSDAKSDFNNFKYDLSIPYINELANKGDVASIGLLGRAYLEGRFFGKNLDRAYELLTEAVKKGDLESYKSLGNLYLMESIYKNPIEAMRLFEYASGRGLCIATNNIGRLFLKGAYGDADNRIDVDYSKAFQWLTKGVECGAATSNKWMGDIYEQGMGVQYDGKRATAFYLKAAEGGNTEAQFMIGKRYEYGHTVDKDLIKAREWFDKARVNKNNDGTTFFRVEMANKEIEAIDKELSKYAALPSPVAGLSASSQSTFWCESSGKYIPFTSNCESTNTRSDSPFNKTADELVDASIAVNRGSGSAVGNGSPFNQVDLTATDLQVAAVHAVKMQDDGIVYANRKALVIGNDSYKTVTRLLTAREDAKAIAAGLTRVGYQVTLKTDLDRQGMNAAIRNFKSQVEGGDEIAIFYAGHGVQLSNTNFLLPIDISGETEEQLKDDAVPLQRLLDDIADRHAKFTLALIDACRDNPFKAPNGRSIGGTRGLSPTTAATGQMIVFSAGTGQQALDKLGPNDKDKNGVFTRVLLKQLDSPGVSIDKLVRNVRMEVVGLAKSVGHDQVPAIYDQVVGDFYFRK